MPLNHFAQSVRRNVVNLAELRLAEFNARNQIIYIHSIFQLKCSHTAIMVHEKVCKITKSYEIMQKNINFLCNIDKKYTFAAYFSSK